MSTIQRRKTDRSGARRQQVLDAALKCFLRDGFHGASMDEISSAAGMSVGHIYHYFKSKDEIIAAICDQDVKKSVAELDEIKRGDDPLLAVMELAHSAAAQRLDSDSAALLVEIAAEATRNQKIRAVLQAADKRLRNIASNIVQKGGNAVSQRPSELEARVELMGALIDGLALRVIKHPSLDKKAVLKELRSAIRYLLQPHAQRDG